MKNKLLCCLLSILLTQSTHATDLMDIYRQALENDPLFKAAYSQFMAQAEQIPQAEAPLLPQLTLSALAGRNYLDVVTAVSETIQTFNGEAWKVNASQTLFNYQAWSQVQQARASVKAALATFNNAAQDLIVRSTGAYLNILLAIDTLNFAEAKKRANKRQLEQSTARFNVGMDPITYVYEAQSAFDQSVAEVISAQNNVVNMNQALSKITNHIYETISPLRNSKIPLIQPEPNNADEWVDTGIKQNYLLLAAKYNLEASRDNIKAKAAGNWPTVSLLGNSSSTYYNTPQLSVTQKKSISQTLANASNNLLNSFFIPSKQIVSNVQIAMNFPVYQGGLVESQTKQAQYQFQGASEQLEKTYRDVVANSRIAFNNLVDGISKIKADRQTVMSQQNSLDSVQAQYEVGTRTMTDVVNAQQKLFQAQQQLASDQYSFMNAILNLKYLAGTLNVDDVEELNAWLATTRINALPPQPISRS